MTIDFAFPKKTQQYDTGVLATLRAQLLDTNKLGEGVSYLNDGAAIGAAQTGIKRINDTTRLMERWSGTAWAEYVLGYLKNTAPTTYGSVAVAGSTGAYAGVQFTGVTGLWTVMFQADGSGGLYGVTGAAWKWRFDSAGSLITGTVPWGSVTSKPAIVSETFSEAATASTIAKRNSSGYLYAVYFNQSSANSESTGAGVAQFMTTNGTDDFVRKASLAAVSAVITPTWTNVSGKPNLMGSDHSVWHASTDGYHRFHFANAGRSYYKSADGTHEFRNNSDVLHAFISSAGDVEAKRRVFGNRATAGEIGLGAITVSTTAGARAGMVAGDLHLVYA